MRTIFRQKFNIESIHFVWEFDKITFNCLINQRFSQIFAMFLIFSLFSNFDSFDFFRDIDFFNSSLSCSDFEIRQFNDVTSFLRNLEHCQRLYRYRKTKMLEYMFWVFNDSVWKWYKKQTHFNFLSRFDMILTKAFSSQKQRKLKAITQKRAKRKARKIAKRVELNVIKTAKQTSTFQNFDIFDSSLTFDKLDFDLYSNVAIFLQHFQQCQHLYRKSNLLNLLSKCLCAFASEWFKIQFEFISLKRFNRILLKAFSEEFLRRVSSRSSNLQLSTLDVVSESIENSSDFEITFDRVICKICKQSFNFNKKLYKHIRNHEVLKFVKDFHFSINAINLICEIEKKSFVTHVSSVLLARFQKSIVEFAITFETITLLKRSTLQSFALENTSKSTKKLSVCRHCTQTFNFKKMFRQHKREQHAKKFVINSHFLLDAIKFACESMKILTINTSFSVSFAIQSKQMFEFFKFFESIVSFKNSFLTSFTFETICQFNEKSIVELFLLASFDTFNSARFHQDSEKRRFNQIVIFIQHLEQCQHLYCESELLEWMKVILYDSVDIWFRNQSNFIFLHDFDIVLTKTFFTFIFNTIFSSSFSIFAVESTCETSEKLVVMKSLDQFLFSQTFESEHQEIFDQKFLNFSSFFSIETVDSTCEVAEKSATVLFAKNAKFNSKRLAKIRVFAVRIRVKLKIKRTVFQISTFEFASKSMKRFSIQQIVCVRTCKHCKQNFNFNNKFHEHIREHHARKSVILKSSDFRVFAFESAYKIKKKSTIICSFVSFASFILFATSRSQIFSTKMFSRFVSSKDSNLSIATHKISSKSMKNAVVNCSLIFSSISSHISVQEYEKFYIQKFYLIVNDLHRMFDEKSKSCDLKQHHNRHFFSQNSDIRQFHFSFSSIKSHFIIENLFEMFDEKFRKKNLFQNQNNVSFREFFSKQSQITIYFKFAINQKSLISQDLKNSKSKNLNQHMIAKSIRIVFNENLFEK